MAAGASARRQAVLGRSVHAGRHRPRRQLSPATGASREGGGLSWKVPQRGGLDGAGEEPRELQNLHIEAVSALGSMAGGFSCSIARGSPSIRSAQSIFLKNLAQASTKRRTRPPRPQEGRRSSSAYEARPATIR